MVIKGEGPCHNNASPFDADVILTDLVGRLVTLGHGVESAILNHGEGGVHDVIAAPVVPPEQEPPPPPPPPAQEDDLPPASPAPPNGPTPEEQRAVNFQAPPV